MYANESDSEPIVELLLENDAGADSEDHTGRTPLSYAAQRGLAPTIRLLLGKGAMRARGSKELDAS